MSSHRRGRSRRRNPKRRKRRWMHELDTDDIDSGDMADIENSEILKEAKKEEGFNPFENVSWKFLDGNLTKQPSRQDLLRYPSGVLTDPQFQDENQHNFDVWRQDYLESLDVAGFMYDQMTTNDFGDFSKSDSINKLLYINDDKNEKIPQTEEDILRETEEYLLSLNRISQHISDIDHLQDSDRAKTANFISKFLEQQQNEENEYIHKRNMLSSIPSTQQLLQNIIDFEKKCENEMRYSQSTKSNKNNQSDLDQDDDDDDEDDDDEDEDNNDNNNNNKNNNDDWDNSRSPSPVIIWRPSSRVTVAKDLPKNLKSVYAQQEKNVSYLEYQGVNDNININDNINETKENPQNQTTDKPKSKIVHKEKWNSNKRKFPAPIEYGAWYIPPNKWVVRKKGEIIEETSKDSTNPELERKATHLSETIPTLFISKMYKTYIMTHKDQNKRYLPKYLDNVEINDKSND